MRCTFISLSFPAFSFSILIGKEKTHLKGLKAAKNIRLAIKKIKEVLSNLHGDKTIKEYVQQCKRSQSMSEGKKVMMG